MTSLDRLTTEEVLALFPSDIMVTDPDVVASYARDQSRFTDHTLPLAVLMPRTTEEVRLCMKAAYDGGVAVVPRGGGSGLSGAANGKPNSVVLSLHGMNDVLEINHADRLAVVQPGVITATLRAEARKAGLFYPPDPGSVDMSTVGGNTATNAGGMCCVKYGVTGDFVMGLEVVLADGRVMRTGRRTVKGVAGYDLTHLFVGSEGTLGVITEITVRLVPEPQTPQTLVASFAHLRDAGHAVADVIEIGLTPSLMEILDRTTVRAVDQMSHMGIGDGVDALLLIQGDDAYAAEMLGEIQRICEERGAVDVVVSSDPAEATLLLEARRLALPALERLGDWLLDDLAVPRSRMVELIVGIEEIAERLGLVIGVFGHAGDGNLHPTVIFDEADPHSRAAALQAFDEMTEKTLELGGTITGEHGVGQLKRSWLSRELDPAAMEVHTSVKAALDPRGILNPGSVLAGQPLRPGQPRG